MKKTFVRFGEIPENEKSGIYDGDNGKVGEELGVSVWEAIEYNGQIRILLPHPYKRSTLTDLEWCADKEQNVYQVEGDVVGYGSDNEPLLRNIRIIKKLENNMFERYIPLEEEKQIYVTTDGILEAIMTVIKNPIACEKYCKNVARMCTKCRNFEYFDIKEMI